METRELVQTALLVAVCVAAGYLLTAIPNVELISACIFTAGVLKGARRGAVVGALAEFLYSSLNPYGMAPFPLLGSQILGMAMIGAMGGVFGAWTGSATTVRQAWLAGVFGFGLTIAYDVVTNVAGYLMVRESTPFAAYMIAGLSFPFPLAHPLGNAAGFALLAPSVRRALRAGVQHESR